MPDPGSPDFPHGAGHPVFLVLCACGIKCLVLGIDVPGCLVLTGSDADCLLAGPEEQHEGRARQLGEDPAPGLYGHSQGRFMTQ